MFFIGTQCMIRLFSSCSWRELYVFTESAQKYRVGQIKWHHFTFLLVTNYCINEILWFLA